MAHTKEKKKKGNKVEVTITDTDVQEYTLFDLQTQLAQVNNNITAADALKASLLTQKADIEDSIALLS